MSQALPAAKGPGSLAPRNLGPHDPRADLGSPSCRVLGTIEHVYVTDVKLCVVLFWGLRPLAAVLNPAKPPLVQVNREIRGFTRAAGGFTGEHLPRRALDLGRRALLNMRFVRRLGRQRA